MPEKTKLELLLKELDPETLAKMIAGFLDKEEQFRKSPEVCKRLGLSPSATQIPKEIIMRAIHFYEEKRLSATAAEIAKKGGMIEESIRLYKKAGLFDVASEVAQEAGLVDVGIDVYIEAGRFTNAITIAEEYKRTEKLIEIYEKMGRLEYAIKIAEEAGLVDRAIQVYEKAKMFDKAARIAKKCNKEEKVIQLYAQSVQESINKGLHLEAAELSREAHRYDWAISICRKYRIAEDFVENCEKKDNAMFASIVALFTIGLDRAMDVYLKKENYVLAASIAKLKGREDKALETIEKGIRYFKDKKDFKNAGITAEQGGLIDQAIEFYIEGGFNGDAYKLAGEHGKIEIARQMWEFEIKKFEDNGDYHMGGEFAMSVGMLERAVGLYEKGKSFRVAANLAARTGMTEKAVELYGKAIKYCKERDCEPELINWIIDEACLMLRKDVVRLLKGDE